MGTIIEAAATASSPSAGAVALADAAARACLQRAQRAADDVDLLINAGVYLDRGISEPAIAALIQEDISANVEQQAGAGQGTLSFDVRNGSCGLLTGIHLVDGMLASGTVSLGMVVATDADPEPGVTEGFAFPALGGAMLLSADDSRPGFTAFRFATFPEHGELFQSAVAWRENGRDGRNVLTVVIADEYAGRALDCAESTARELAAAEGGDLGEVGLLIASASVAGFAGELGRRLGLPGERVAPAPDGVAAAHTAALAAALESGRLADAGTALFVSVGAGLTAVAALYRA
jgi:3-oxoacyl-[acyl-carrier-protein] synthase III